MSHPMQVTPMSSPPICTQQVGRGKRECHPPMHACHTTCMHVPPMSSPQPAPDDQWESIPLSRSGSSPEVFFAPTEAASGGKCGADKCGAEYLGVEGSGAQRRSLDAQQERGPAAAAAVGAVRPPLPPPAAALRGLIGGNGAARRLALLASYAAPRPSSRGSSSPSRNGRAASVAPVAGSTAATSARQPSPLSGAGRAGMLSRGKPSGVEVRQTRMRGSKRSDCHGLYETAVRLV